MGSIILYHKTSFSQVTCDVNIAHDSHLSSTPDFTEPSAKQIVPERANKPLVRSTCASTWRRQFWAPHPSVHLAEQERPLALSLHTETTRADNTHTCAAAAVMKAQGGKHLSPARQTPECTRRVSSTSDAAESDCLAGQLHTWHLHTWHRVPGCSGRGFGGSANHPFRGCVFQPRCRVVLVKSLHLSAALTLSQDGEVVMRVRRGAVTGLSGWRRSSSRHSLGTVTSVAVMTVPRHLHKTPAL